MQQSTRAPSFSTWLVRLFILGVFSFLCWRALLVSNQHQPGLGFQVFRTNGASYYTPTNLTVYEDAVTLVTARNFVRDGFVRTRFLPNRRGHPLVSLYDVTQTQCESLQSSPDEAPTYWNMLGNRMQAVSISGDCVYTHYPPLADWVFGALAVMGFDEVIHYKMVAILANCGLLLALYQWLRREVRSPAAVAAVALAGTLPAFLEWGDVLYYHCFQYLLLVGGLLTWSSYLRDRRARWLFITWILFFLESLISYQLTLFFALVLGGLLLLERPRPGVGTIVKLLSLQASAPLMAFGLHFGLICSLLGLDRAWWNLRATMVARVTEGSMRGFGELIASINASLLPLPLLGLGVLALVVARRIGRASMARPLGLLGMTFVGGVSFMLAMPGTTSEHGWMMYRQLMPFVVLLFAFLAEASWVLLPQCIAPSRTQASATRPRIVVAGCLVLCLVPVGCAAHRNATHVRNQIAWNVERNRHADPANLVQRKLEVVYWTEGRPDWQGNLLMPVSGMRVGEAPAWMTDMRLAGPAPSHYEIWWLDDVELRRVHLLANRDQVDDIRKSCSFSLFDRGRFRTLPEDTSLTIADFEPADGERRPEVPYSWLRLALQSSIQSRALRFTCSGLQTVVLRQLEAFSQ